MKIFRLIGTALLSVVMSVNLASCSSDSKEEEEEPVGPPQSSIEDFHQTDMNFTEKAGEQAFSFTANAAWVVSVASTSGGSTWCTASPAQGNAGSQTVRIAVTENDTYDDRSVTVTLRAGNESQSFVVTQKQKNAILLTSDKFEIGQEGGTFTVEVKANVNYTATIGETCKDWITEGSDTRALSATTRTYSVAANEESEKREGTITFTDGTLSETVHVYQAGGDIILLSTNEYHVDAAGEEITVELRSNCEYEVEMPAVDWIHTVATRGMSSHTLHYTIDANTAYDSREAKIVYRNRANDVTETLTIVQAQKDAIILGQKEVTVKADGTTITVKLSANVDFEVEMPDVEWIHAISTRAMSSHTLYYTIDANSTYDSREAKIVYRNKESDIVEALTIVQVQKDAIILGQKEVTVKAEGETIAVNLSANVDFEVEMPDVDWIHTVATRGMSSHTLYYTVDANTSYDNREAKIVYRNRGSGVVETLTIVQVQKDAIILGQKEVTVGAEGETIEVKLSTNVDFEVEMPDVDWITSVATRGLTEHTLYYNVAKNEGIDSRSAQITFTNKNSGLKDILTVQQEESPCGTINVPTAGELPNITNRRDFKALKLTGYLNGTDIKAIREMQDLEYLDISEAHIVEGGECYLVLNGKNLFTANNTIGDYMFYETNLKQILLPNSVTTIGEFAFYGCSSLTSIDIPNSVTTIEAGTFGGCGFTSIVIPNSVTTIGASAFGRCSSLASIDISNSVTTIEAGAFQECISLTSIDIPDGVTTIGGSAFHNCSNLTRINIPNSVTTIETCAFYGCSSLTNIDIPNSVITIGRSAFYGCSSLTSINIPDGVTTIGGSAFEKCTSLTRINIPNSVTIIEEAAFQNCSSLTSVEIPNSVTTIGNGVFGFCSNLTSIDMSDGVTTIGDCAFYGCSSLASIDIPNSVITIGRGAFYGCSSLTSIGIPNGVTTIGMSAFEKCTSLTRINIPNSVTTVETCAFDGCSSLTSIDIPNGVTTIENCAFRGCSSLTSIGIPNSVTTIGNSTFDGCSNLTSIAIPNSVTTIGNSTFSRCSSLASIDISDGVTTIGEYAFLYCTSLTSIDIPNSVTTIEGYAFYGCSSLTSIDMSDGVTTIGYGTFSGCSSLTSIAIPDGVTTIGESAFYYCSSLTSIAIPDGVTTIGDYAFYNCSSLTSIDIPDGVTTIGYAAFYNCSSLTSIDIPNSVTTIGDHAFQGCSNLTSIAIPDGVTTIGYVAFYNCSSLTSIDIPNSVTTIGEKAFQYCNNLASIKIGTGLRSIESTELLTHSSIAEVHCYATNPPAATDYDFDVRKSTAKLYVPKGSRDSYAQSTWGKAFTNIIGMEE